MKYACLFYIAPENDSDDFINPQLDYDETLRQSRHLLLAEALQGTETATCVRVRNGKTEVTDGPFAETKEALGSLYIIEAKDLDDALAVAAKIPVARIGTIEVRRLRELTRT